MIVTGVALLSPIAYPPGYESGSYNVLFDVHSSSTTSHIITVDDHPFVVQAFGLVGGETVQVWAVGGPGNGTWFERVYVDGNPVQLTATDNKLSLDVSGRYEFRLVGGGLGTVFVVGHNATVAARKIGFGKFVS